MLWSAKSYRDLIIVTSVVFLIGISPCFSNDNHHVAFLRSYGKLKCSFDLGCFHVEVAIPSCNSGVVYRSERSDLFTIYLGVHDCRGEQHPKATVFWSRLNGKKRQRLIKCLNNLWCTVSSFGLPKDEDIYISVWVRPKGGSFGKLGFVVRTRNEGDAHKFSIGKTNADIGYLAKRRRLSHHDLMSHLDNLFHPPRKGENSTTRNMDLNLSFLGLLYNTAGSHQHGNRNHSMFHKHHINTVSNLKSTKPQNRSEVTQQDKLALEEWLNYTSVLNVTKSSIRQKNILLHVSKVDDGNKTNTNSINSATKKPQTVAAGGKKIKQTKQSVKSSPAVPKDMHLHGSNSSVDDGKPKIKVTHHIKQSVLFIPPERKSVDDVNSANTRNYGEGSNPSESKHKVDIRPLQTDLSYLRHQAEMTKASVDHLAQLLHDTLHSMNSKVQKALLSGGNTFDSLIFKNVSDNLYKIAYNATKNAVHDVCLKRKVTDSIVPVSTWSAWKEWEPCSISCGKGGYRIRRRNCHSKPPALCYGNNMSFLQCNHQPPCPASWLSWEPWSHCSASCGQGLRVRSRPCVTSNSAVRCHGSTAEVMKCFHQSRTKCTFTVAHDVKKPVVITPAVIARPHAGITPFWHWTPWSRWSSCSVTCGRGRRERTRACISWKKKHLYHTRCRGSGVQRMNCFFKLCGRVQIDSTVKTQEGKTAHLKCEYGNDIFPTRVFWITPQRYKITRKTKSRRYKMHGTSLLIKDVQTRDHGIYKCIIIKLDKKQLALDISLSVINCKSRPCLNGGTCQELNVVKSNLGNRRHFYCICQSGYRGKFCGIEKDEGHFFLAGLVILVACVALGFLVCLYLLTRSWHKKKTQSLPPLSGSQETTEQKPEGEVKLSKTVKKENEKGSLAPSKEDIKKVEELYKPSKKKNERQRNENESKNQESTLHSSIVTNDGSFYEISEKDYKDFSVSENQGEESKLVYKDNLTEGFVDGALRYPSPTDSYKKREERDISRRSKLTPSKKYTYESNAVVSKAFEAVDDSQFSPMFKEISTRKTDVLMNYPQKNQVQEPEETTFHTDYPQKTKVRKPQKGDNFVGFSGKSNIEEFKPRLGPGSTDSQLPQQKYVDDSNNVLQENIKILSGQLRNISTRETQGRTQATRGTKQVAWKEETSWLGYKDDSYQKNENALIRGSPGPGSPVEGEPRVHEPMRLSPYDEQLALLAIQLSQQCLREIEDDESKHRSFSKKQTSQQFVEWGEHQADRSLERDVIHSGQDSNLVRDTQQNYLYGMQYDQSRRPEELDCGTGELIGSSESVFKDFNDTDPYELAERNTTSTPKKSVWFKRSPKRDERQEPEKNGSRSRSLSLNKSWNRTKKKMKADSQHTQRQYRDACDQYSRSSDLDRSSDYQSFTTSKMDDSETDQDDRHGMHFGSNVPQTVPDNYGSSYLEDKTDQNYDNSVHSGPSTPVNDIAVGTGESMIEDYTTVSNVAKDSFDLVGKEHRREPTDGSYYLSDEHYTPCSPRSAISGHSQTEPSFLELLRKQQNVYTSLKPVKVDEKYDSVVKDFETSFDTPSKAVNMAQRRRVLSPPKST